MKCLALVVLLMILAIEFISTAIYNSIELAVVVIWKKH